MDYKNDIQVSIHAPTRGATAADLDSRVRYQFQSTHPHGVRQYLLLGTTDIYVFQSTHPHGVRLVLKCGTTEYKLFQSTHPHGVRLHLLPLF